MTLANVMIFSSDISRARSRAATRRATCFYFASRAQMWRHSTTFSDADAVTDAAPTPTPRRNRAMRSTPTRQSVDARVTALEAAMEKTDARSVVQLFIKVA